MCLWVRLTLLGARGSRRNLLVGVDGRFRGQTLKLLSADQVHLLEVLHFLLLLQDSEMQTGEKGENTARIGGFLLKDICFTCSFVDFLLHYVQKKFFFPHKFFFNILLQHFTKIKIEYISSKSPCYKRWSAMSIKDNIGWLDINADLKCKNVCPLSSPFPHLRPQIYKILLFF